MFHITGCIDSTKFNNFCYAIKESQLVDIVNQQNHLKFLPPPYAFYYTVTSNIATNLKAQYEKLTIPLQYAIMALFTYRRVNLFNFDENFMFFLI